MNQIVLVGRLCRDSELKFIGSNETSRLVNTIAVDRDYKKADGTKETDFINIELFGKRAENLVNYLTKGKMISISGSLRINNYTNEAGEKRSYTSVNVDKLNFISTGKINEGTNFNPAVIDPNEFQPIDDDGIPF